MSISSKRIRNAALGLKLEPETMFWDKSNPHQSKGAVTNLECFTKLGVNPHLLK